jgi:hypothetical protein
MTPADMERILQDSEFKVEPEGWPGMPQGGTFTAIQRKH